MKPVILTLAATLALTACRHPEVAQQHATEPQANIPVNPIGFYPGHTPTEAELNRFPPVVPTPEQAAADKATARRFVGTWTATDLSDSARWYPILLLRTDGSFAVTTKKGKLVSQGTWTFDRGVLLLRTQNTMPGYYGFHVVYRIDEHHLVCGIDIDVAGRLSFTK
jgi:hypothetical protein